MTAWWQPAQLSCPSIEALPAWTRAVYSQLKTCSGFNTPLLLLLLPSLLTSTNLMLPVWRTNTETAANRARLRRNFNIIAEWEQLDAEFFVDTVRVLAYTPNANFKERSACFDECTRKLKPNLLSAISFFYQKLDVTGRLGETTGLKIQNNNFFFVQRTLLSWSTEHVMNQKFLQGRSANVSKRMVASSNCKQTHSNWKTSSFSEIPKL